MDFIKGVIKGASTFLSNSLGNNDFSKYFRASINCLCFLLNDYMSILRPNNDSTISQEQLKLKQSESEQLILNMLGKEKYQLIMNNLSYDLINNVYNVKKLFEQSFTNFFKNLFESARSKKKTEIIISYSQNLLFKILSEFNGSDKEFLYKMFYTALGKVQVGENLGIKLLFINEETIHKYDYDKTLNISLSSSAEIFMNAIFNVIRNNISTTHNYTYKKQILSKQETIVENIIDLGNNNETEFTKKSVFTAEIEKNLKWYHFNTKNPSKLTSMQSAVLDVANSFLEDKKLNDICNNNKEQAVNSISEIILNKVFIVKKSSGIKKSINENELGNAREYIALHEVEKLSNEVKTPNRDKDNKVILKMPFAVSVNLNEDNLKVVTLRNMMKKTGEDKYKDEYIVKMNENDTVTKLIYDIRENGLEKTVGEYNSRNLVSVVSMSK